jgi:tRNA pseudouridine55 synthase
MVHESGIDKGCGKFRWFLTISASISLAPWTVCIARRIMFGILAINKPIGITSREVVNRIERLVRPLKCGHAGTLDPLATGVLLLPIGSATKLTPYFHGMTKSYRGTFLLGQRSDTEDTEGDVVTCPELPEPTLVQLQRAAAQWTGNVQQRPPIYSAIRVAGKRAYERARRGQNVSMTPRPVTIHRIEIVHYQFPTLILDVQCGTGTYLRSVGRDVAESVGSAAVMSGLERTAIGPFTSGAATTLEQIESQGVALFLRRALEGLGHLPHRTLNDPEVARVRFGQTIPWQVAENDLGVAVDGRSAAHPDDGDQKETLVEADATVVAVDRAGEFVALMVQREPGYWKPFRVV